eukprot:839014-Ditylum_brightwellii.AAC.1
MADIQQYIVNDLFGDAKELSSNITADIESLQVVDYTNYVASIAEKDDAVSIAIKDMHKILAVSYYNLLGFKRV